MAISLVGTANNGATSGADVTVTLPAGLAENDIVLVMGGHGNASGSAAASISTSGYAALTTSSLTDHYSFVSAWKRMGASPDSSVTGVGGGSGSNAAGYVVMVFRGVDTSTAIDATTTTDTGASGDPNSPAIVTATNGAAVVSCFGKHAGASVNSGPSGYGDLVSESRTDTIAFLAGAAWKAIAVAGAENPAAFDVALTGQNWAAHTIALRPAAIGINMDGAASATGTGTATFGSSATAASPLSATGTGTATFTGVALATVGAFSMTGTGTVGFDATQASPFSATGSWAISFVGGRSRLSSVRDVIETGKVTVSIS